MFIFDSMSATVLAIIVTFISILAAVVTIQIENAAGIRHNAIMLSKKVVKVTEQVISSVFTAELLDSYRAKMVSRQPIDNDRILPGSGKTHTLMAIGTVVDSEMSIPSVLDQVGDVFS